MGITQSKDETNIIVRRSLKGRDILDEEGLRLREEVDKCLSANMWWCTIAGVVLSIPACILYKTEKPLLGAAILSPLMDMAYATQKCAEQRDTFLAHYDQLRRKFQEQVALDKASVDDVPPSDDFQRASSSSTSDRDQSPSPLGSSPSGVSAGAGTGSPGSRSGSSGFGTWPSRSGSVAGKPPPVTKDEWVSEDAAPTADVNEGIVFEDLPKTAPPKKKGWW